MNNFFNIPWFKILLLLASVSLFVLAFGRTYLRTQSTLLGYELGVLKLQEAKLLEGNSGLKMQLSQLSTKSNLMLLSGQSHGKE